MFFLNHKSLVSDFNLAPNPGCRVKLSVTDFACSWHLKFEAGKGND